MTDIKNIRNIGIMAHIDAGKTTTTERILFYTKKIHKIGEIDNGEATMDFMDQEQARGITIQSAATTCYWLDTQINIIDTPGHVDFTAEVERSLRVLDGAILVLSAVDGVQAQTQTVWKQADEFCVPRLCYVNKMDRVGANYLQALSDITQKFNTAVLSLQVPIGEGEDFAGVIDLLLMKELRWDTSDQGVTIKTSEIDASRIDAAKSARDKLIDTAASYDDALGEMYLNGDEITNADLIAAIRREVISRKLVVALMGSSRHNIGVQPLLDAIVKFLPCPTDVTNKGHHLKKGKESEEVSLISNDTKPLAALLFKVQYNKDAGFLCYVRVYSGKITSGAQVLNTRTSKRERVNRIIRMNADKMEQMTQVSSGDIAVLIGPKDSHTGDTFSSEGFPVMLEKPTFPQPVISSSLECENLSERQKLSAVLDIMAKEDPTFSFHEDEATGQLIISGMGELHLDVLVTRMKQDFGIICKTGNPQVTYREGVTTTASESVDFSKIINGKQNTAGVTMEVSPIDNDTKSDSNVYECLVHDKTIPSIIYDSIENTVRANFTSGINMGYPCSCVKITIKDIRYSAELSNEFAFGAATAQCFDNVCNKANPCLLEPVMNVEITSPVEKLGEVSSILIARGGLILGQNEKNGAEVLSAQAPMSKMFGFATALRSATGGLAEFSMEFSHFQKKE